VTNFEPLVSFFCCCSWVTSCKFENHIVDWIQASTSFSFQFLMFKAVGVGLDCTIFSNRRLFLNRLPFNAHCPFNISIAISYYMNFIRLNASTYRFNVHRLYTMHITHYTYKVQMRVKPWQFLLANMRMNDKRSAKQVESSWWMA
jgi:hypothetical protein